MKPAGEDDHLIVFKNNSMSCYKPAGDVADVHLKEEKFDWYEWVHNFCKHISDWSYNSALEELEIMKDKLTKQSTEPTEHVLPEHLFCKCENGKPCFDTEVAILRYIELIKTESYSEGFHKGLKKARSLFKPEMEQERQRVTEEMENEVKGMMAMNELRTKPNQMKGSNAK